MNPITLVALKLEYILKNSDTIISEELESEKEFIADLNREQLRQGTRPDGTDMPNYVKGSKQPSAPGKITLFDKGKTHKGITPIFKKDHIDYDNTDPKSKYLIGRVVPPLLGDWMGLTRDSMDKLAVKTLPGIKKRIKQIIKI